MVDNHDPLFVDVKLPQEYQGGKSPMTRSDYDSALLRALRSLTFGGIQTERQAHQTGITIILCICVVITFVIIQTMRTYSLTSPSQTTQNSSAVPGSKQ